MSGNLMVLLELSLIFAVVFGWGFNELRQLKKYDRNKSPGASENAPARQGQPASQARSDSEQTHR